MSVFANTQYEIAVDKRKFDIALEKAYQDPRRANAKNFDSSWIHLFLTQIEEFENIKPSLQASIARVYPGRKRSDASFFHGNAYCKFPKCLASYSVSIKEKSTNPATSFMMVNVTRKNEHLHNQNFERKVQIRGEERLNIAKKVMSECNGSAIAFVDKLAATGEKNLPSEHVIRNVIHEYVNKEMVSTCWITNLLHSADSAEHFLKSTRKKDGINGYVQNFEIHKNFSLNLHTEEQIKLISRFMSDFSWATIHAALEVFNNNENISEYSMRVYNLSRLKTHPVSTNLTWLGSCNSHTMHRFVKLLKYKEERKFAILCFSLLVNCVDLETFDAIFNSIEKLSPSAEKTINFSLMSDLKSNFEQDDQEDIEESSKETIFKKNSIKESSPFTEHFNKIKESVLNTVEEIDEDENSGFVFRELNISRLTNGTIEKFFSTRKKLIKTSVQPGIYVTLTSEVAVGQALRFKNKLVSQNDDDYQPEKIAEIITSTFENPKLTIVKLDEIDPCLLELDCDIKRKEKEDDLKISKKRKLDSKKVVEIDNVEIDNESFRRLLENDRLCDSKLDNYDFIFGPVFDNNHSTLMFVDLKNCSVLYIDPFGASKETTDMVMKNWM
ncbi:unnamed protein product [Brachionus calyciflorus]|uniref:Uncharacterized protein n=1 Tax=Brachionus calyciflorus TaxID=104777 RepID=A0A814NUS9_9BILA|nr:unnamed protein product [Brachionus calyciflorus]